MKIKNWQGLIFAMMFLLGGISTKLSLLGEAKNGRELVLGISLTAMTLAVACTIIRIFELPTRAEFEDEE